MSSFTATFIGIGRCAYDIGMIVLKGMLLCVFHVQFVVFVASTFIHLFELNQYFQHFKLLLCFLHQQDDQLGCNVLGALQHNLRTALQIQLVTLIGK